MGDTRNDDHGVVPRELPLGESEVLVEFPLIGKLVTSVEAIVERFELDVSGASGKSSLIDGRTWAKGND